VSDDIDNDTTVINDDTSNDDDDGVNDAVFFCAARDIMNWVGQKEGTAARKDHSFHEHFGLPFMNVQMMWDMLVEGGLLLTKGKLKHLLWMLYF
jgi:hypothetical protein